MQLGVIGIRSKHLKFFAEALAQLPQSHSRITHICGYDAPEKLPLPYHCCDTPQALIAVCDAVIVALRDGTQHMAVAEMALRAGKPVFVDKPFACAIADAEQILRCAEASGVPCTGGSTLCFTPAVRTLAADLPQCKEYTLSYTADPFDPYGGWYFYGSHLTDLCTTLFGAQFLSVEASLQADMLFAEVQYAAFTVHLRSTTQAQPPILRAERDYILDDTGCYRSGMAHFLNVAAGKENGQAARLVASVRLMDAIFTSLRRVSP